MLHDLSTSGRCRDLIRMSENAFKTLCQKLESDGSLRPTQRRSGSATSRHFHRVLNAIISLEDHYIKQPSGDTVQKEIQQKKRFYPFFKDCIGAIDGTHVRVRVPSNDALRYRGRKFYLVDGGLPHRSTLIAPYRGIRYHLKEYSARAPQNSQELFNLRHASLRNSIERAFGVLKKRFPIIRSTAEPFYSCETQSNIFLACCILLNFLLEEDRDTELEDEVAHELLNAPQDEETRAPRGIDDGGEEIRNSIANEIWNEYLLHPNNEINMSN
ncbi:putative nuclease HARBI1 [Tanacetum coccineum]